MSFNYQRERDEVVIHNPLLKQVHDTIVQTMNDLQEPYRIRIRRWDTCEVLRVFTVSTDCAIRFSVLDHRPNNVHMTVQRFITVYSNETRAGWNGERTMDFPAKSDGALAIQSLAAIAECATNYLALNRSNARSPREGFPCVNNRDKAPNRWAAASFVIEDVRISSGGADGYQVEFLNHSSRLGVKLKGDEASVFQAPQASVGCRAIIHDSGCVRVMRETNFRQLYSLV